MVLTTEWWQLRNKYKVNDLNDKSYKHKQYNSKYNNTRNIYIRQER